MKHDNDWLHANMPLLASHEAQRKSDTRMYAIFYCERMSKEYKKRIKELEARVHELEEMGTSDVYLHKRIGLGDK